MNTERFHNQLALHLGYKHILDRNIDIYVDEKENADDPVVTIKIKGYKDIVFKASEKPALEEVLKPEMCNTIKQISDAVHDAYVKSTSDTLSFYINGIRKD